MRVLFLNVEILMLLCQLFCPVVTNQTYSAALNEAAGAHLRNHHPDVVAKRLSINN
jgi:hypothetical protein